MERKIDSRAHHTAFVVVFPIAHRVAKVTRGGESMSGRIASRAAPLPTLRLERFDMPLKKGRRDCFEADILSRSGENTRYGTSSETIESRRDQNSFALGPADDVELIFQGPLDKRRASPIVEIHGSGAGSVKLKIAGTPPEPGPSF